MMHEDWEVLVGGRWGLDGLVLTAQLGMEETTGSQKPCAMLLPTRHRTIKLMTFFILTIRLITLRDFGR